MTDCPSKTPDRDTEKTQQKQAATLGKTDASRSRAPSGSVTVSDIGGPFGSTETQSSYESVDFGESGEELI